MSTVPNGVPPELPPELLAELRQQLAGAGAPDEVLQLIDRGGSAPELLAELERLAGDGGLPSPKNLAASFVEEFRPLLKRGTDPLQAEQAGAEIVGLARRALPDPDDLLDLLRDLVRDVAKEGSRAALAMLRVLAVVGPAAIRADAAVAGDELVAAGRTEPPWAGQLGGPRPEPGFGYADILGVQEAVTAPFRYGRRRHAMCVLIDHGLGGGVKDCWLTDEVDQVRASYEALAAAEPVVFHEYEPAGLHAVLSTALEREPCPEQPDQIQDVDTYLDLLRQRVSLLAPAAAGATAPRGGTVHRLKISLRGARPPIWRRLEVPSWHQLSELHQAIQAAFGWHGYHLWVFETWLEDYGQPDSELGHGDAASVRLDQVAGAGDRFTYTYDFGDDWVHVIQVEAVEPATPGTAYPRCLTGRRARPPEDCGGIWGYAELLEVLDDPGHPEHAERLEWLGLASAGDFDPAAFDLAATNQRIHARFPS